MMPLVLILTGVLMDYPMAYVLRRVQSDAHRHIVLSAHYVLWARLLLLVSSCNGDTWIWACVVIMAVVRGGLDMCWGGEAQAHPGWFVLRQAVYTALALALPYVFGHGEQTRALFSWCVGCVRALRGQDMSGYLPLAASLMLSGLLLLLLTAGAGQLIGLMLLNLRKKRQHPTPGQYLAAQQDTGDNNMGLFIGWVERILMLTFAVTGHYGGLAVLVAVKTAARYPEFHVRAFAEYYILGTLLSLLFGIVLSAIFVGVLRCV